MLAETQKNHPLRMKSHSIYPVPSWTSVKGIHNLALLASLLFVRSGTAQALAPAPAPLPTPILALSFDDSNPATDDSRSGNTYSIVGIEDSGNFTPATATSFDGSG